MAIFDVLKTAAKIAQEAGKIELYGQILEVYEKLLEQQKRIADLESEKDELHKALEIAKSLVAEGNVYWAVENDGRKDGPFCTCCWDSERALVRLHVNSNSGSAQCPKCKNYARSGQAQVFYPRDRRNPAI